MPDSSQEFSVELNVLHDRSKLSVDSKNNSTRDELFDEYDFKLKNALICVSKGPFIDDWKKALSRLSVRSVTEEDYPVFFKVCNIFTDKRLLLFSAILCLWNTIAFFLTFESCFNLLDGGMKKLVFSALIIPICANIFHGLFSIAWRGSLLSWSNSVFVVKEQQRKTIRYYFDEILTYLETDAVYVEHSSPDLLRSKKEMISFYIIFGYLVPILSGTYIVVAGIITVSAPSASYQSTCTALFGYGTLGLTSVYLPIAISGTATLIFFMVLRKTSKFLHYLIYSWMSRVSPIRRISVRRISKLINDVKILSSGGTTCAKIRRDFFERYYLIHHFFRKVSHCLEMSLTVLLTFSASFFIYFALISLIDPASFRIIVLWLAVSCLMFFFIASQVATANTVVNELKIMMNYSIPLQSMTKSEEVDQLIHDDCEGDDGDYEIIGGNEAWMSIFEKKPVYWTIFGCAITATWLQTFVVAAIGSVFASIIPLVSSFLFNSS